MRFYTTHFSIYFPAFPSTLVDKASKTYDKICATYYDYLVFIELGPKGVKIYRHLLTNIKSNLLFSLYSSAEYICNGFNKYVSIIF